MPVWSQLVALAAGGGVVWAGIRRLAGVAGRLVASGRRLGHLVDDLMGEEPRDGVSEGRPGVLARLERVETRVGAIERVEARVGAIEYQLHRNGGKSMRDQLDRIETAVGVRRRNDTAKRTADAGAASMAGDRTHGGSGNGRSAAGAARGGQGGRAQYDPVGGVGGRGGRRRHPRARDPGRARLAD